MGGGWGRGRMRSGGLGVAFCCYRWHLSRSWWFVGEVRVIDSGPFDGSRGEEMWHFPFQARSCCRSRTRPRFRRQSKFQLQRPCCEGRRPRLLESGGCGWFDSVAPEHCSSEWLLVLWIGCFDAGAAGHTDMSAAEDGDVLEFDVVGWGVTLYIWGE